MIIRITETADERRKSLEERRKSIEDLLTDPVENGEEETGRPEDSPENMEQIEVPDVEANEKNTPEESVPDEIPFDDILLLNDSNPSNEEPPVSEYDTKNEPIEIPDTTNSKVSSEPTQEKVNPETPSTCENPDSMDQLRLDLEQLTGKGRLANPQSRPVRKVGEVGEGEVEVKEENATWYNKPPMSPELLIAIAVRNLDPHKEVKVEKI